MMKNCKYYKSQFVEALYDELDIKKQDELNRHVQFCEMCREELEQMKQTIRTMENDDLDDPGSTFWDGFYHKVETRISKTDNDTVYSVDKFELRSFSSKYIYPAMRVAAILIVGFLMGYIYFYSDFQQANQEFSESQITKNSNVKMVAQQTTDYLEDAKVIILGIVNLDSDNVDPASLDFSRQQEYSRQLVKRAAVLKNDLAGTENKRVLELISELEMILMQIANYESKMDLEAVDLIKSGVDNQAILLKINLEKLMLSATDNEKSSQDDYTNRKDL